MSVVLLFLFFLFRRVERALGRGRRDAWLVAGVVGAVLVATYVWWRCARLDCRLKASCAFAPVDPRAQSAGFVFLHFFLLGL